MDMGISKEETATSVHVVLRHEAKDIRVWFPLLYYSVESGTCISSIFSWCLGAHLFSYMVLKRDKKINLVKCQFKLLLPAS